MAYSNRYAGRCAQCGVRVAAGAGFAIKVQGQWAVVCSDHLPEERVRIVFALRGDGAYVSAEGYLGGDRFAKFRAATREAGCQYDPAGRGNMCGVAAATRLAEALRSAGLEVAVAPDLQARMDAAAPEPELPAGPRIRFSARDGQAFVVPDGFLGGDTFTRYLGCTRESGCKFQFDSKGNLCSFESAGRLITALKAQGFHVLVSEELMDELARYVSRVAQETQAAGERLDDIDARLAKRGMALYGYQRAGVQWLAPRTGALLADHPGLGKTVQVLASLPQNAAVVVVCPAVAKGVWKNETAKWRPDLRATVLDGRGSFRWPASGEIVVTNYAILPKGEWVKKHVESEPLPDPPDGCVLVADECHALKGDSQQTYNFLRLSKLVRAHSGRTWLLTGTPLVNRPPELYKVLTMAGLEVEAFTSFTRYMQLFNAYKGKYGIEWGHPEPEVGELLKRVMLRRIKSEVLADLPAKSYQDIEVAIDAKYRAEIAAFLRSRGMSEQDVVELLESGMARTGSIPFEEYSELREVLSRAKLPATLEIVKEYEEAGDPLIVFDVHVWPLRQIVEQKRAEGKRWALIIGETPAEERTRIVEEFQAGRLDGIAASIKSSGVAITLTRANTSIWNAMAWDPASNEQAEDRIHRIGQTRGVRIIRVVADHPIDRRVVELLSEKQQLIDATIEEARTRPGEAIATVGEGVREALQGVIVAGAHVSAPAPAPALAPALAPVSAPTAALLAPHGPRTAREHWAVEGLETLLMLDPDRALEKNEMGFNASDGGTGRLLLARLHSVGLRPGEWIAAESMLRKYHGQIGRIPPREADDYALQFEPSPTDDPPAKKRVRRKRSE